MLEGLTPPKKEPICPMVAKAVSTFDKKDLRIFTEALNNPLWSAKKLSEALTDRGFVTTEKQIHSHRGGRCSCLKA